MTPSWTLLAVAAALFFGPASTAAAGTRQSAVFDATERPGQPASGGFADRAAEAAAPASAAAPAAAPAAAEATATAAEVRADVPAAAVAGSATAAGGEDGGDDDNDAYGEDHRTAS